jgi:hypothetical protein
MKVEIKIIGATDAMPMAVAKAAVAAAGEAGMESAIATYSYGNKQTNAPIEWIPEVEPEPEPEEVEVEQASVMEIKFASVIAARLADELNLSPSVFEGVEPSGKKGYTVADVKWIAE